MRKALPAMARLVLRLAGAAARAAIPAITKGAPRPIFRITPRRSSVMKFSPIRDSPSHTETFLALTQHYVASLRAWERRNVSHDPLPTSAYLSTFILYVL